MKRGKAKVAWDSVCKPKWEESLVRDLIFALIQVPALHDATRSKGKEIAKALLPPFEFEHEVIAVIDDVMRHLSFDEIELDGKAGFGDVADTYVDVEPTVNVDKTKEHVVEHVRVDVVVYGSGEESVVYGSGEKDVEQGSGEKVIEETSGEEVQYNVDEIDIAYETQFMMSLVKMQDVPFDNIDVTSLVREDVFEEEDVDVVNVDGFESDTNSKDETEIFCSSKEAQDRVYLHSIESRRNLKLYKNDKTRIFDQVRVNQDISVNVVQDQLQCDLEL
nr:hypothetical protein [Tanacetum cinerariifolium]